MPPPFKRVRDKRSGDHISVRYVDPDIHVELKQPGEDKFGRPFPAKLHTTKGGTPVENTEEAQQ